MHPPAELALAAGTPGSGSLRSQLRFRPMNLPLKASVLINSISGGRSTWANFCLLHCRAQAHPHPLSKNRIQSWRGGRRLESKNEFKTRSKTTQPRRRENKQRRAKVYARAHTPRKRAGEGGRGREARAEAVCCHPGGTGSQAWQPAQVSGRDGGGGWRCSCQEQQLGIPGESGLSLGLIGFPRQQG